MARAADSVHATLYATVVTSLIDADGLRRHVLGGRPPRPVSVGGDHVHPEPAADPGGRAGLGPRRGLPGA